MQSKAEFEDLSVFFPKNNLLGSYIFSTAPIISRKDNEEKVEGTGFFVHGNKDHGLFVSCKHVFVDWENKHNWENNVFKDEAKSFLYLLHGKRNEAPTTERVFWKCNPESAFFPDDKEVDLIAFRVFWKDREDQNQDCYFQTVPISLFPDGTVLSQLECFTNIVIIGYPDYLWDDKNNLPIPRCGVLSLPASVNFRGDHLGVIDVPCYEGDSGSPVFAIKGDILKGYSYHLLGVHSDGTERFVKNNLAIGFYTKSEKLAELLKKD